MAGHDIDDLRSAAAFERIGAEGDHRIRHRNLVHRGFVIGKRRRSLKQPGMLAVGAQPVEAFSTARRVLSTSRRGLLVSEFSESHWALAVIKILELALSESFIQVWHRFLQSAHGFRDRQRLGSDPDAEFILIETCLDVGHEDINKSSMFGKTGRSRFPSDIRRRR